MTSRGPVTAAEAARLLGLRSLTLLGEGQDFRVFRSGARAYRFPRREGSAGWLDTEARLLMLLAPALPLEVPRVERPPEPGPWRTRHTRARLVRGVPATRVPTSRLLAMPAALGAFLGALHAFPPESAAAVGVPERTTWWAPRPYRARAARAWSQAPLPLPPALERAVTTFLRRTAPVPPAAPGPPRLVHGDLEAEHVIVDARSGRVVGVIDWADASLADPARDFAALWAWGGRGFLDAMLAAYPHRQDPGLRARIAFLGRVFAILDHVEAGEEGPDEIAWTREQLARAFDEDQSPV